MKKSVFIFMMMAVFAAMCVTSFTACDGDDDDDIPGKEVSGSVTYYEPCFDWGSTNDHVKAYMTGWELVDGSNDYALLYSNGKNTTTVTYAFLGSRHGLSMVTVTYITGNVNYFISEIQKRYGITLTKDDASSKQGDTVYSGNGTIGGRNIAVILHSTSATVTVIYGIPD